MKQGLLPINIKFTDRMKYYDVFSVETLATLVADYEIQELERYISIIKNE